MRHACLISIAFLFAIAGTSECAFRDDFLGARSMAMGGAYTALADDVDGALVNPAGLSMVKNQQILATMAYLYMGLSDGSTLSQNIIGYAYKGKNATGIIWKRFGVSDLYSENIVALCHARTGRLYLTKGEKRPKNLSIGGTLKLMNWDSAPTMDNNGRIIEDIPGWTGATLDIGFVMWISENTPIAVSFQNIIKPDISSKYSKIKEILPGSTRMGVAAIENNTIWAMDLILESGKVDLQTGIERRSYDGKIFFRTGLGLENLAWGMNITIGAGYKPNSFLRIDYAFVYPVNTIVNTMGSHRISVVYNFGGK